MPKVPAAVKPPAIPTMASYLSRGQSREGMGQRPNKLLRPITGSSAAMSQKPSLLGGL